MDIEARIARLNALSAEITSKTELLDRKTSTLETMLDEYRALVEKERAATGYLHLVLGFIGGLTVGGVLVLSIT